MARTAYELQQNVGGPVSTIPEFTYKNVSLASGTSKDISGKGCILRGVIVNTVPAAAVTITDGSNTVAVIPTSATAGLPIFYGDVGLRTNCRISHTAGAGDLTFIFKSF